LQPVDSRAALGGVTMAAPRHSTSPAIRDKWMIQLSPKRQWYALPLVFMMWEGGIELANFQCRQFLGGRFHRLDPLLPQLIDIDDVKRMGLLKKIALEEDLSETIYWLDAHFEREIVPLEALET